MSLVDEIFLFSFTFLKTTITRKPLEVLHTVKDVTGQFVVVEQQDLEGSE